MYSKRYMEALANCMNLLHRDDPEIWEWKIVSGDNCFLRRTRVGKSRLFSHDVVESLSAAKTEEMVGRIASLEYQLIILTGIMKSLKEQGVIMKEELDNAQEESE